MRNIYLDHNSTTPILKEVIDGMMLYHSMPLNPSSVHFYGQNAKKLVNDAKSKIKEMVNADKSYELIFTASGTESNNIALSSFSDMKILVTTIEHPSIIKTAKEAMIPVDTQGLVDLEALKILLQQEANPCLVSVMLANNETGVIQDIAEIAEIVHSYNGILHTDASQACGRIKVDLKHLDADMITISSHKMGGPGGASALLFKKHLNLKPIMYGGGQELRLRPGTQNVLVIIGFGIASEVAKSNHPKYEQLALMRNKMEERILKTSPNTIIFSKDAPRLPNTSSFTMPEVDNDVQVIFFDTKGIAISAGAACSSGSRGLPYVQMSMGYSEKTARTSIRVSLGVNTNESEIDYFIINWEELFLFNYNKQMEGTNA